MKKTICLFIFSIIATAVIAMPGAEKKPATLSIDFTYSPDTIRAGVWVQFTVTPSGNPFTLTCHWDWGDGTTWDGWGESYSHTFQAAGTYTVKVVSSTNGGAPQDSVTKIITVLPASIIIADFTYFPDTVYSGTPVFFYDNSYVENGHVSSMRISLDSGAVFIAVGPDRPLTFGQPGVYNLYYGITTNYEEYDDTIKTITVLPGGQATLKVCPGISKQLWTGTGTAPYQWQLSTDNGNTFNNISDNPPYTGSNNYYLTIASLPSSYYGYIYRCVSATDTSTAFKIEFSNSFTSGADTNWENTANWSCGSLPDGNTDVIINGGNVIINSNAVCRTIRLLNGANVTVATGYTLTVTH